MENDRAKFKNDFKKRTYAFVQRLLKFIDNIPKSPTSSVLGKQLIRSGTSILANYIEAGSASSKRDFTNFFNYSLKSANESKVWLALLKDACKVDKKEVEILLKELGEIANILASSIITLKDKK